MLRRMAFSFIALSSLMHIFCCGIPLLLSLTSVVTLFGLSSTKLLHLSWFVGAAQEELLIISGIALVISFIALHAHDRTHANSEKPCASIACNEKKSISHWTIKVASGLYGMNILLYFWLP